MTAKNNDANGDSQWLCISFCDSGLNRQIKDLVVFCVSSAIANISLFSHSWSMIYMGNSYKAVGYHHRPTHPTEDGPLGIKFPTYTEACVSAYGEWEVTLNWVDTWLTPRRQRPKDASVRLCGRRTHRAWGSLAG